MKLSLRIFLVYFLLVGVGLFTFFSNATRQLHPILRQSAENALVDSANLLAEILARDIKHQQLQTTDLAAAVERYNQRNINATIWNLQKNHPDLKLYITDNKGKVVFHSDPTEIGKDYSNWLDVSRTLKGEYGARTTPTNNAMKENNELTRVMHVAAPIIADGKLQGVLTLMQPNASSQPFLEFAHQQLLTQGSLILVISLAIGAALTYWLTRSVRQLSLYVQKVRRGERAVPPTLYESELAELAEATETMRQALEGKAYIENYVHTLTHEMKSPLAAIRGAAELLEEGNMEPQAQQKFLHNIVSSSHRLQDLIDRLLALAALENQQTLENPQVLNLIDLTQSEIEVKQNRAQQRQLQIHLEIPERPVLVEGDDFLLRQAISNLLDNALNFANHTSKIVIQIKPDGKQVELLVSNNGPWIPDYGLSRVFERFYSLPNPATHTKSSGLGLSFVREIATLHGGAIYLSNTGTAAKSQVTATLILKTTGKD